MAENINKNTTKSIHHRHQKHSLLTDVTLQSLQSKKKKKKTYVPGHLSHLTSGHLSQMQSMIMQQQKDRKLQLVQPGHSRDAKNASTNCPSEV